MLTDMIKKVRAQDTELPLRGNEFTTSELLKYLNTVYITKLNGDEFTIHNLMDWIRLGNLPVAYGGHELHASRRSGIRVLTVIGLNREDVVYIPKEHILKVNEIRQQKKPVAKSRGKNHIVQHTTRRTKLYYQMAKLPVPKDVLPPNWKDVGIRGDQLTVKKRKR